MANAIVEVGKNSYQTLEIADEYFDMRLPKSNWNDFPSELKERALIQAAKIIDKQILKGRKCDYSQKMAFPRYKDRYAHYNYYNLNYQGETPDCVLEAQCELALFLLNPIGSRQRMQSEGVTAINLDGIQEQYDAQAINDARNPERAVLRKYMGDWLTRVVRQS